jgi:2-methylisocitrate lyase-like PEP mutase family enzyme
MTNGAAALFMRTAYQTATIYFGDTPLERSTGVVEAGPPKSRAGSRTVSFPALILPDIQEHLENFSGKGRGGLVFCALATASHSIAASYGYPDGEQIPRELMIDAIGRIAAAVDLPVSADLESGYGDVADTVRRAIGVGVVGANLEDGMRPLGESVDAVSAAVRAGEAEGIRFVLNARTDAFLKAGDCDPEKVLADAIERGRAFIDAGAACVFVPGRLDSSTVERLVAGIGQRKVSLIGVPGSVPSGDLQRLGVARLSFGPWSQRAVLTALQYLSGELLAGGALPEGIRPLN